MGGGLGVLLAMLLAQADGGGGGDAAACVWKEPKQAPKFELLSWRGAEVRFQSDARWFNCVKKAGSGTLTARFTVKGEKGTRTVGEKVQRSWSDYASAGLDELCADGPGEKWVSVQLEGAGDMARLGWASAPERLWCQRCPGFRHYDDSLGFFPWEGGYMLRGSVDKDWHACAKPGSTLQLWLYAAPTRLEAEQLKEPTHKLTGLEAAHRFERKVPKGPLCKGGTRYIGFEMRGTGEMEGVLEGRGVIEARCGK